MLLWTECKVNIVEKCRLTRTRYIYSTSSVPTIGLSLMYTNISLTILMIT